MLFVYTFRVIHGTKETFFTIELRLIFYPFVGGGITSYFFTDRLDLLAVMCCATGATQKASKEEEGECTQRAVVSNPLWVSRSLGQTDQLQCLILSKTVM